MSIKIQIISIITTKSLLSPVNPILHFMSLAMNNIIYFLIVMFFPEYHINGITHSNLDGFNSIFFQVLKKKIH